MMQTPQGPAPQQDFFEFTGGLDQTTTPMKMPPGRLLECVNWDIPADGGYRRIPGCERFDGQTRPSDASAVVMGTTTTWHADLEVGDTIEGDTSTETGVVAYISADRTYIAVTKASGAFTLGEDLLVGLDVMGDYQAPPEYTPEVGNAIAAAAADIYRADIEAPPGAGAIRGGWSFGGVKYVFRDNAGGTAVDVWKATTSGWSQVALAEEVAFTDANANVGVGDTLTQGGVTATIRRVIVTTGTLVSGTNTGKLVISGRAGGNFAAGAATSTGSGALTLSAAQTAQAFPPGGKYRFRNHNFGGAAATRYMYGVNGVGQAFEFDGTYFAFIATGAADDKPSHIAIFKNQLFLAQGASLQHSAPGEPHIFSVVYGAGEIASGANITNLLESTAALQVYTFARVKALVGTGVGNWNFDNITDEGVGAYADTVQPLAQPIFFDDTLLITGLAASQKYGNFEWSTMSAQIRPHLNARKTLAACSVIVRKEGQYKLFFTDGTGVTMTFKGDKMVGAIPFSLPFTPNVAWSDDESGDVFVGATNGMVYELGRGRNLDGAAIDHRIRFAWNFVRAPLVRKRFRRATFDAFANGYVSLNIGYQVTRNDPEVDTGTVGAAGEFGASGVAAWDDPDVAWDEAGWDGDGFTRFGVALDVTGTDISFTMSGSSDNQLAFSISGQTLVYQARRLDRRYQ